ncbi:sensor histidine kinase [Kribbella sp. NPDC004536]|uniref:sensor histidine kinase n=1 Tax=Kribbella sp. NPDC004536 TaxID=3364106 RepID=UPI00367F3567
MGVQLTRPVRLVVVEWTGAVLYGLLAWGLFAHKGQLAPSVIGTAAAAAGLALVRRRPVWSVVCCLVALMLSPIEPSVGFIAVPVACLAVFRLADRRRSLLAVAAVEVGVLATALPDFRQRGGIAPFGSMVLAAWIVGRLATRYRRQSEELVVQQERMRIARELHDIVAHSMGVITVQSGYGHAVIDSRPEAAREALATIEQTGRRTLAELRSLLGVLRSDEQVELAPAPGLAELEELVARTGKAGVRVDLTVSGLSPELPAGVQLSAYRIVQEALTNVVKHAAVPVASASVVCRGRELAVEVVDHGAGCADVPRAGHGLAGLRERVALYGGTLQAGPLPDKGFRVSAVLPLAEPR